MGVYIAFYALDLPGSQALAQLRYPLFNLPQLGQHMGCLVISAKQTQHSTTRRLGIGQQMGAIQFFSQGMRLSPPLQGLL